MERNKIKLNTEQSQRDVNVDMYQNIFLSSESQTIPYNDINRVINENEQFNLERNSSNLYRIISTINPLFTNILFNATGEGSWETFNQPLFRDRSFPPNGISLNEDEDYTYEESIEAHLKERDGWFGYLNPKINGYADNEFYYMEPTKEKFELVHHNNSNWDITVSYPASKLSNSLTDGGLKITHIKEVTVGGKKMVALGSPYNHNLNLRDEVKITGIGKEGIYQVMRMGLDNGDFKKCYFVVDANITISDIENIRFKKVYSGVECEYYFRLFKRVTTVDGGEFSNKDYDLYPLAFSKNVFNDTVYQFATKDDLDLTGLTDNLGRPVTEVFLSFIKRNNKGFSTIKSGLDLANIGTLDDFKDIPDIKRIHNGIDYPFVSHTPIEESVEFGNEEFVGDLVEYNKMLLKETVLNEVAHRFNTTNRESGGNMDTALPTRGSNMTGRGSGRSNQNSERDGGSTSDPTTIGTTRTQLSLDEELIQQKGLDDMYEPPTEFDYYDDGFAYLPVFWKHDYTKEGACSKSNFTPLYADNNHLISASFLSIDSAGNLRALSGWYSDGRGVRFWNGTTFDSYSTCNTTETPDEEDTGDGGTTTPKPVILGSRQEGYFYKPFYRIQLKNFSDYIEYGDEMTEGIPSYAEKLEDGRYIWRDLMDFGNVGDNLDHPFLNGRHYIHRNHLLAVRRQDPFGEYNLYHKSGVPDIPGIKITEKYKTNKSGDIC